MSSSSSVFSGYKIPKKTVLSYKSGSIEIRESYVQKVSNFFLHVIACMPQCQQVIVRETTRFS